MNRIALQLFFCVAVLVGIAFWPATAEVNERPPKRPIPPMTTFNPKGTPCEGYTCPSGRRCAVNENKQASCVCDIDCSYYDVYYYPICGSDNKTHWNYCDLTIEACKQNTNIEIIHYGACHDLSSACAGVTCPSNRECAIAENRAACVCIQTCPPYSNAVCGSDNQTYINDCELLKKSCTENDEITIAHQGECNKETVCSRVKCPKGMKCAINERHKPVCVCIDECPYSPETVCGSDDRTYGNECELNKEACNSATRIKVAYKGFCLRGSVCYGHKCPADRECSVDENNRPVCGCIQSCSYDYNPVCGSDGITYKNLCDFKRMKCITGNNVTVARTGQCVYWEYCYDVVCPELMSCMVDANNETSCACFDQCGDYYYPVCGSDNNTHINYCYLNVAACKTNTSITGLYDRVCSEGPNCEGIYCPYGTHCDSLNQPEPECVCDTDCPKTYNPLCGSNNKTYDNNCELQRDACLTNTSIYVQFYKRCEEGPGCDYTYCPYDRTCVLDERKQPVCVCYKSCYPTTYEVCGTDNKTYSNDCFLNAAACLTNKSITVQRYGQCEKDDPCKGVVCSSDRNCELDDKGRPICVCNERCEGWGTPVCGSDNETYVNYCELRKQACLSSTTILWLYYGSCVEASICDGVSCSPDKKCAVDEQKQPTCVCIDQCLNVKYPVCGSDGCTYFNECELEKEACMSNTNVTLAYRGQCGQGLTCSDISCPWYRKCALNEKNQPTCVCNTECYYHYYYYTYQVCGTNGKTYENDCYLQIEACTTDSNIKVDYDGPCNNGYTTSVSI